MRLRFLPVVILVGTRVVPSSAQSIEQITDAQLPRFETASVKPGDPNSDRATFGIPPGRFVQENYFMTSVLTMAFGARPFQLPNPLPAVLRERYSINARMPDGATPRDRGLMLRALLIDGFRLRYHIEAKEQDGYALTMARRDGRFGPGLRLSTVDCTARREAQRRNEPLPPLPGGAKECGVRNGRGLLDVGGMSIAAVAQMLSNQTGRDVVDKTGITGLVDVDLHFSLTAPLQAGADRSSDDNLPSIFVAVQEQLGLKLEPTKTVVDYLVIDHVERPDPD